MKNIRHIAIIFSLIIAWLLLPQAKVLADNFLYGDVSGDGEIWAYDAAIVARYAVWLPIDEYTALAEADFLKAANVDGSLSQADDHNGITAYDAALIAQRVVGLIDKFPVATYNSSKLKSLFSGLPSLDPTYLPLDPENKVLLYNRLTQAFDLFYATYYSGNRNIATDTGTFYYFRQELQALLDMYRATKKLDYLETAKGLVFKAIADANANQRTLLWDGQNRGTWPCFLAVKEEEAGGHGQLNDFQGATGLMMVASALKQANMDGWQDISNFVEHNIVEKWLYFNPNLTFEHLTGSQSNIYLLDALQSNRSRDVREHFASICLDLSELGYQKYPYRDWSQFLFDIYLTEKTSLDEPYPDALYRSKVPTDWGLYHQADGTLIWSWGLSDLVNYGTLDTSHANRTSWAVCQAFEKGMLPENATLNNLIASFKKNIWAPEKGPFYFNNFIDGTDPTTAEGMGPGGIGNIWFGWNRLAAYDESLRDLFISIAYDLTLGGLNITPSYAQNKAMANGPLCLIAWASRLLAENGQPELFP